MASAISIIMRPLAQYYDDANTVEIRMTEAKKVILDRRGTGKTIVDAPELTLACIEDICRSLANFTGVKFHPETAPKLSCVVPEVRHRFECLVGSSVQSGVSLAIRCKHDFTPTWEQVGATPEVVAYLRSAMDRKLNMIIAGGTNTGKTTLIKKLLEFLEADCRVVAAEDTPELPIDRFWDGVGLLAAREESSASGMIDWRQLYDHKMRATPDYVIFGEISTQNAYAALGALTAGINGWMCSIHAGSPQQVIERKFAQNIAWSGKTMPHISELLSELVDVIVQIKRSDDGNRRITDIYEPSADRWVMKDSEMLISVMEAAE